MMTEPPLGGPIRQLLETQSVGSIGSGGASRSAKKMKNIDRAYYQVTLWCIV